jgi:hypothetical protein
MLFLIAVTTCSLTYIYLSVYLLTLHLVALGISCLIYAARTDVDAVLLLAPYIC